MGMRVLIVDDAAFMRMRCSKLLSEGGYEVREAATGTEAVASYKSNKPDCVLMDITMPVWLMVLYYTGLLVIFQVWLKHQGRSWREIWV